MGSEGGDVGCLAFEIREEEGDAVEEGIYASCVEFGVSACPGFHREKEKRNGSVRTEG